MNENIEQRNAVLKDILQASRLGVEAIKDKFQSLDLLYLKLTAANQTLTGDLSITGTLVTSVINPSDQLLTLDGDFRFKYTGYYIGTPAIPVESIYAEFLRFSNYTNTTSLIPSAINSNVSITVPNLNGTMALTGVAQNWSTTGTLGAGATTLGAVTVSGTLKNSSGSNMDLTTTNGKFVFTSVGSTYNQTMTIDCRSNYYPTITASTIAFNFNPALAASKIFYFEGSQICGISVLSATYKSLSFAVGMQADEAACMGYFQFGRMYTIPNITTATANPTIRLYGIVPANGYIDFYHDGTSGNINAIGTLNFGSVVKPIQAATASAPTYVKGGIYFDTTLNKLRVGGATAWETVTSV